MTSLAPFPEASHSSLDEIELSTSVEPLEGVLGAAQTVGLRSPGGGDFEALGTTGEDLLVTEPLPAAESHF